MNLDTLFRDHNAHLVNELVARLGGERGEEIAAQTWLRVVEKQRHYNPELPFRPWLYRIAWNLAKTAHRSNKSYARRIERFAERQPQADDSRPDVNPSLFHRLAALPQKHRAAIYWTEIKGLTTRQAGDLLGVSHKTIQHRSRAARAMILTVEPVECDVDKLAIGDALDAQPAAVFDSISRVILDTGDDDDFATFGQFIRRTVGENV